MLAYFDDEKKQFKADDKSQVITSDIIDSMYGYYKGRKSPDKQTVITCTVHAIPLMTKIDPHESNPYGKLMKIFTIETVNTVSHWRK